MSALQQHPGPLEAGPLDTGRTPTAPRLLGPAPTGPVPQVDLPVLVDLLAAAGLTGRGGAGFPTARKLAAVAGAGSRPVVVGNAMEGEHLSRKDAHLLAHAPDLVLDGLEVLGAALGAKRRILAVGHRTDPTVVRAAAAARRTTTEVRTLGGGFVAGQESALVNALNGRSPVPSDRFSPVWRRGVDHRPTLVVNAETLAQVALVARHGAAWFREAGTRLDPGTFLVSVSGSAESVLDAPCVLEVPRGTPLVEVLQRAGARLPRARAVLVGGYHGTWLTPESYDVPLSVEGLAEHGAGPGAGVLHVLDRRHCPLGVSADVATYLARESAGQCGPCVNGLPRLAATLTRLARGPVGPGLVEEVERVSALVVGRGACHHPDGTARLVASTLGAFADHVAAHLGGTCPTGGAR